MTNQNKKKPVMIGSLEDLEQINYKSNKKFHMLDRYGKETDKEEMAVLKSEEKSNLTRFFVKFNVVNGEMFNALKDNDLTANCPRKYGKRPLYEFREVTQDTFDLYSSYIQEGYNNQFYIQARINYIRG